jgi:hypothetical protein
MEPAVKKAIQKKIDEATLRTHLNGVSEGLNRARSITVGTCGGGTIEVAMRRADGSNTFIILQPVEVVELIHQLSAQIGCHLQMLPRRDFASWRDWKYTPEELAHYRGVQSLPGVGHPPHSNDMAPHQSKGQVLPPPDQQPGLALPPPKDSNETVATQKPQRRHRIKRAATAA